MKENVTCANYTFFSVSGTPIWGMTPEKPLAKWCAVALVLLSQPSQRPESLSLFTSNPHP